MITQTASVSLLAPWIGLEIHCAVYDVTADLLRSGRFIDHDLGPYRVSNIVYGTLKATPIGVGTGERANFILTHKPSSAAMVVFDSVGRPLFYDRDMPRIVLAPGVRISYAEIGMVLS